MVHKDLIPESVVNPRVYKHTMGKTVAQPVNGSNGLLRGLKVYRNKSEKKRDVVGKIKMVV